MMRLSLGELVGWTAAGWAIGEVVYQPWREGRRAERARLEERRKPPRPAPRALPAVTVEVEDPDTGEWWPV